MTSLPVAVDNALRAFNEGRRADAERLFHDVLARSPDDPTALQHLGLLALSRGDAAHALALLGRAVECHPRLAQAHSNFGNALARSGRLQAAVGHFRQAIALDPSLADAYCNLGLALTVLGATDEAVFVLHQALALRPGFVEAHVNLGGALLAQKRVGEATDAFTAALGIAAGHAGALTGVAQCLADQGRMTQAIAAYRRALAAAPDFSSAYVNLGCAQLDAADVAGAIATFRAGLQHDPASQALRSNLLMALQYDPSASEADSVAESRAWEANCLAPDAVVTTRAGLPARPQRLRIGFVSADFRSHPVGWFLRAVLPCLPRERFEVFGYPNQAGSDALTHEIAARCVAWRSVFGIADAEAAAQIRADGVDVLVDLSGHTAGNRLGVFALRAAPLQLSWLGYFATTGLTAMDGILLDESHAPAASASHFTERVERLAPIRFCYSPPAYAAAPAPAPVEANGFVTFGGFHNVAKLNDAVLDVWARILARVPGSRLVLRWKSLSDIGLRDRLLRPFLARGIAPGRIVFQGAEPHDTMLALYREIDLALDPFPFSGATTTCEALWMGVPVLTWPGSRAVSRQSAAILRAIGHEELCAASADDYIDRAVALAGDAPRLASYRTALREDMRASPLSDPVHFAGEFTRAVERAWDALAGAPATSPGTGRR
ncbi:MAG: tetratricopeptide repeat protein [Burkholderiales bacterium]